MRDPSDKSSCCLPFREEFQRSKFSLHHEEPADFCRSQWQRGERCFIWLVYRWLLAAFFGAGVIGSLVGSLNGGTWFIYLTDWGFTLCWYACTYGAVVATIHFWKPRYFVPGSWALKIYWISHFSTVTLALLITLVFWAALYPTMPEMGAELYNLWAHAFNTICMLFDCFMVAFPTRLMHFIYPFAIGLIYGVFSLIYYLAGGEDFAGNRFIYYILDWSKPGLAIGTVCGCVVLMTLFCILIFWIYRLRLWLYGRCVKSNKKQATSASTETVQTV
ncbi:protein rolling stone-like [Scaptodrosophila lebanonensis]|uniref:Protein rolling stone-like n=1 Tax=Drosophila lebanonensis TaxID=7225 RepID=A0A6J2TNB9_DROLE|nr:protein rolling stone-like [Scaptodrosophila lebanonensis]